MPVAPARPPGQTRSGPPTRAHHTGRSPDRPKEALTARKEFNASSVLAADTAREHYAKEVFDLKHVKQAIETRAAEGYRDLRLVQDHPFDLSRSASAGKLENWLEENQYRYVWSPTAPVLDPLHSALSEDYPELAIFW